LSLQDYFQKYIFEPLGLSHLSFFPSEAIKEKLAYLGQRSSDGQLSRRDHILQKLLQAKTEEEKKSVHCSGGAGLFGRAQDFARRLSRSRHPPGILAISEFKLITLGSQRQKSSPPSSTAEHQPSPAPGSSTEPPSTTCSPTSYQTCQTMHAKA
jgi:CubicO group peptidase (beta-lactamase class C family)